jgi:hypothetical protein
MIGDDHARTERERFAVQDSNAHAREQKESACRGMGKLPAYLYAERQQYE